MRLIKLLGRSVLITAVVICMAKNASTHPAGGMELDFDNNSKVFNIKVNHTVRNAAKHFIKEIKVYLNKKLCVTQTFMKQNNNKYQEVFYVLVDAELKDKIEVKTEYNLGGILKKTINVKEEKDNKKEDKQSK